MTTLVPRRNRSLFDQLMSDPFDTFFGSAPLQHSTPTLMRTDIKEHEGGYDIVIDLPGFKKEDVQASLKEGVLTVTAKTSTESNEEDPKGTYVRKERFTGQCSRSFYVGEDIEEADVKAKFENGTLQIGVPKKQALPAADEALPITIEG
ncbi:MAG: Hsp20/alpha crystallin family protein [Eggerthellaceae bacterium]|nr:Hsp20/alpha crystallin family protein [Eggerthellaceae bacterium]